MRSPKWPGSRQKKVRSKILKSAIFELHKRQKKAENNRHSDLKEHYTGGPRLVRFLGPGKNHTKAK